VLCATEFERSRLAAAGVGELAELVRCGPGGEGIVSWAESHDTARALVILAGVAGGLRPSVRPGRAYWVSTVFSQKGRQFQVGMAPPTPADPRRPVIRAVAASADAIVTTPREKQAIAETTGADLVDLESGVFAEAAEIFGWRWAIVRGVSDDHETTLPAASERWISPRGRVRGWRVAMSVLRRPWIVPLLLRLRRDSRASLAAVAELLKSALSGTIDGGLSTGTSTEASTKESPRASAGATSGESPESQFESAEDGPR